MSEITGLEKPVCWFRASTRTGGWHINGFDLYDVYIKNFVFFTFKPMPEGHEMNFFGVCKAIGSTAYERTRVSNYLEWRLPNDPNNVAMSETIEFTDIGTYPHSGDISLDPNWQRKKASFNEHWLLTDKGPTYTHWRGIYRSTLSDYIFTGAYSIFFNPNKYTDADYSRVFGNYRIFSGGGYWSGVGETLEIYDILYKTGEHTDYLSGIQPAGFNGTIAEIQNDPYDHRKLFGEWIDKCMLANGIVPQIAYNTTKMNWDIYIDGTYNPNVKIKWKSDAINSGKGSIGIEDISKIKIEVEDYNDVLASDVYGEYSYTSLAHSTNYTTLYKSLDYPSFLEFTEKIRNLITGSTLKIKLSFKYLDSPVIHSAYFTLTPDGKCPKSGVTKIESPIQDVITIHYGSDNSEKDKTEEEEKEEKYPNDDINDREKDNNNMKNNDTNPSNVVGTFNKAYAMSPNRVNQLSSFLWNASFFDNIKLMNNSPIENIISCKLFPFSIGGGSDAIIKLGNVATGVNGKKISNTTFSARKSVSAITCERVFNNFLDFEPFTKVDIYIPFIGFKQLQPSKVIGKSIRLEFIIDIVTGSMKCIVFSNNINIAEYDGNCGIDMPMSASNRAQIESSYLVGAVGLGATIGTGGVGALLSGAVSMAMSGYHTQTQGQASPSTGLYSNMTPYVLIDRPSYVIPNSYGKTKGFVCNKTLTLGSLNGFTVCDPNVNLSGICATKEELEKIKEYLTTGFFA